MYNENKSILMGTLYLTLFTQTVSKQMLRFLLLRVLLYALFDRMCDCCALLHKILIIMNILLSMQFWFDFWKVFLTSKFPECGQLWYFFINFNYFSLFSFVWLSLYNNIVTRFFLISLNISFILSIYLKISSFTLRP